MTTPEDVLRVAASHLGYKEGPKNNQTIFGKRTGFNFQAWCGSFIDCNHIDAGLKVTRSGSDTSEPSCVSTLAGWKNYKRLRRVSYGDPVPGDVGFINPGPHGHVVHVRSYDKVNRAVHTIEGNTSPGNQGSQYNGGGVYNRIRPRSLFVGFGKPLYTRAPVNPQPKPQPQPQPQPQFPSIEDFNIQEVDMYIAVHGVGFFAQFGNCTIPLPGLDLAGFAKLLESPKSVGFMHIPEQAKDKFLEYAMKQTYHAIN